MSASNIGNAATGGPAGSFDIKAESTGLYFIPVVGIGVAIYRAVKDYRAVRKVKQVLNDLKWEDRETQEVASKILGELSKKSSYVKTAEFYKKSAEIISYQKGKLDLLQKGKVFEAFQSMEKEPKGIINEWFKKKNWGESYNKNEVLEKLREEAVRVKNEKGICPEYFYVSEMHQSLKKSEGDFANYLRQARFIEKRRKIYDTVNNKAEFEALKTYDISWIKTVKGSYETETQIGQLLKKIRSVEHKIKGESDKSKIAILTCCYGKGHETAAIAVESYVDADVSIIDPASDVLLPTQWFYKLGNLFGKEWKDPDIFNYILKKQLYKLDNYKRMISNFWYRIFKPDCFNGVITACPNRDTLHKELLRKRFLREMPDQIVTVYHMALNPVVEVAQEMGIPVLHLATDYDCKGNEVVPNAKKVPGYDHFKFSAPIQHEIVTKTLAPLQEKQKVVCGFPIRRDFLTKTSMDEIAKMRADRNLDPDTKVVLMMGGGGGQKVPFPDQLAKLEKHEGKLRVIVVAGANVEFAKEIEALKAKSPNITFEVAKDDIPKPENPYFVNGQTINKLMDLADVIVTKSGGASTSEALQKGLPILFDHRKKLFSWEEYNIWFVKVLGRGRSIKTVRGFVEDVTEVLKMKKVDLKLPDASVEVPKILNEMKDAAKNDQQFFSRRGQYERA